MGWRGWAQLVAVSVLWGIPYLLIDVSLSELSPATITFVRLALGAAILLPPALARGGVAAIIARPHQLVTVALLDTAAPFLLIANAQRTITSALAGVLVATVPIFVVLLAPRLDPTDRIDWVRLAGCVAGLVGVTVLFGVDLHSDATALPGAVQVLAASTCYAAAALLIRRWFAMDDPVALTAVVLTIAAIGALPLTALDAPGGLPSARVIAALAALGSASTAAAFLLFYRLIQQAGASRASLVTYLAPAVAVLAGVLILNEPVTSTTLLGLGLIVAGSAAAGAKRRPTMHQRFHQPPP